SPVGGCASSASTGIDAHRGGLDVGNAREGQRMAEEIEWFVGVDWASQSRQVCLVDARGECLGELAVAHGGLGIEEAAVPPSTFWRNSEETSKAFTGSGSATDGGWSEPLCQRQLLSWRKRA